MASIDMTGSFESASLGSVKPDLADALSNLHNAFKSSIDLSRIYDGMGSAIHESAERTTQTVEQSLLRISDPSAMDSVKLLLDGTVDSNGRKTLSLSEIGEWKINDAYREQNIKQQSGFAAELLSTYKENVLAESQDNGIKTFRADDRPDLGFAKNDQFVDKVRVNADGEIVERVQTKFIGRDGKDWVDKMTGKKYDKYFDGDHVDKIECPRDYYDGAKEQIVNKTKGLQKSLERVTAEGKTEVAEKIQRKIDKLSQLDEMIEQSTVSTDEARTSRLHPARTAGKLFATETLKASRAEGLRGGVCAAGLTFVGSTVTHAREFLDGEIAADEMASRIAMETGASGLIGAGTGFITTAVANSMQSSSCNLIRTIGGSCLPAAVVSFSVESYDSITDFAQGAIGADELAYDLGHNAAMVVGGMAAGAQTGALVGSVLGPAGMVGGSLVGGLVGTAVASGIYETAVEHAPEVVKDVGDFIQSSTDAVMEGITNQFPEQVENARAAFNDFFSSNNIPIRA